MTRAGKILTGAIAAASAGAVALFVPTEDEHRTPCTGVPGEIRAHNDAQLTNVTAVIHR